MTSMLPLRHPKYRTKLCRNFVNGDCPLGQKCSFLHPFLAHQRGIQNGMLWQSPPPPQGPQFVDEGPSPAASLLLSTSDCVPSGQMPQTRPFSRHQKYLCRHFIRTRGWCPVGAQCRFHHDVAALPSAGIQKAEHVPPFETDAHGEEGKTINGGVLMNVQPSSLLTVSHEYREPSRYTEAELARLYRPMYWPNYTWQPYRSYYVTAPAAATMSSPATAAPSSIMQHNIHPSPQAQAVPPSGAQTSLPLGAYEVNGTTYFPTSIPSVPAPLPATYTFPIHTPPSNHLMAPAYPYYSPPTLPASHHNVFNQTTNAPPSFDPFASDSTTASQLPVVPRLEDYQMSPIQHDIFSSLLSSPSALTGHPVLMNTKGRPPANGGSEHEFPYRPPRDQWVGHTRRISVNVKKQDGASSG